MKSKVLRAIRCVYRFHTQPELVIYPKLAAPVFHTVTKRNKQETLIKAFSINYDLRTKSSPKMCFN